MEFQGKCALVTGAGAGIGRATAIEFAKNGAKVVVVDADAEKLARTAKEVEEYGEVLSYTCDVSDAQAVNAVVQDALSKFGKIDILVNNAGIFRDKGDFMSISVDLWKRYFEVNVMGMVHFIKATLPQMLECGYGRIVNVGSVAGVYGLSWFVDYSMSKGAVISFTKALAKAVSDKGVTVNCVSPGSVAAAGSDIMKEFSFVGRAGTYEEMANVIIFVASEEASYISGQNYLVDGCRKQM